MDPTGGGAEQSLFQRKVELEKALADTEKELIKLNSGTWDGPIADLSNVIVVNITTQQEDGRYHRDPEFHPELMPKFGYGSDLHLWIAEMEAIIELWGEQVVCPHIPTNCFLEGDTVKLWYINQHPWTRESLSKGPECWSRFKSAMSLRWVKPLRARRDDADNRHKMPDETYTQYCVAKRNLCAAAYLDAMGENLITKIREGFDPHADRFCRELYSLDSFLDELIDYNQKIFDHGCQDLGRMPSFQNNPRPGGSYHDSNYNT